MSSWSDGYFTDLEYLDSYFANLHPQLINLNLTFAGYDVGSGERVSVGEDISYLELGFGRGVSLAVHSLGNDGCFVGTDFNPSHALNAKKLIGTSQRVRIYDDSFEELLARLQREDLQFDFIVLHGIWSWVSYKNTRVILKIVQNHLKVGGVVYNSYNCYPGWDGKSSARRLLTLYQNYAQGTPTEKALACIKFFQNFLATKPEYAKNNPRVEDVLAMTKTDDEKYLIQEFFNASESGACYFTDMAEWMSGVKCEFVCGADVVWHFMGISDEASEFISKVGANAILKEQLKDYCYNRQFRSDLFIKGKANISQKQIFERFLNTHFVATNTASEKSDLNDTQREILSHFAKDNYSVKTARQIQSGVKNLNVSDLAAHFAKLIKEGFIFVCKDSVKAEIQARCDALNERILNKQRQGKGLRYLVSPLSGSGIVVDELSQLFLIALKEGVALKEGAMIDFVCAWLHSLNRKVHKEGQIIEGKSETRKVLAGFFENFHSKLPLYKVLGIA